MSSCLRGECGGNSGVFPASFVRIIDAFPGTIPSASCTLSYRSGRAAPSPCSRHVPRDAEQHQGNEYDNTRPAFGDLDAGLKAAFAPQMSQVSQRSLSHGARIESVCSSNGLSHSSRVEGALRMEASLSSLAAKPSSHEASLAAPLSSLSALKPQPPAPSSALKPHQGFPRMSDSLTAALRR